MNYSCHCKQNRFDAKHWKLVELDKGLFLTAMAKANNNVSEDKLLEVTKHKTSLTNLL